MYNNSKKIEKSNALKTHTVSISYKKTISCQPIMEQISAQNKIVFDPLEFIKKFENKQKKFVNQEQPNFVSANHAQKKQQFSKESPFATNGFLNAVENYKRFLMTFIVEFIEQKGNALTNERDNLNVSITFEEDGKEVEEYLSTYLLEGAFSKKRGSLEDWKDEEGNMVFPMLFKDLSEKEKKNYWKGIYIHYGGSKAFDEKNNVDYFDRDQCTWDAVLGGHPFRQVQEILLKKRLVLFDDSFYSKTHSRLVQKIRMSCISEKNFAPDDVAKFPQVHGLNNLNGISLDLDVFVKKGVYIICPTNQVKEMIKFHPSKPKVFSVKDEKVYFETFLKEEPKGKSKGEAEEEAEGEAEEEAEGEAEEESESEGEAEKAEESKGEEGEAEEAEGEAEEAEESKGGEAEGEGGEGEGGDE
jgi:hypothetical protein